VTSTDSFSSGHIVYPLQPRYLNTPGKKAVNYIDLKRCFDVIVY